MHKRKIISFLLLGLFCACPNVFAQSGKGKADGIHKEFYGNGKIKFEYMVKGEKLSGFYERYDEEGELEYRHYYIDGIFDGTDRKYYYFPLFAWYHHFGDEGEEVNLESAEALALFGGHYVLADAPFEGDLMGMVLTRVPVEEKGEQRFPVTLAGISRNFLYLKEFKERKDVKPQEHQFYELVRKYRARRDDSVDALFNADVVVEIMQGRHTGIEFGTPYGRWKKREGSRLWSVEQYLGEPDYVYPLKPSGWFDVYYERENLRIVGHNGSVYFLESGRPEWVAPQYLNTRR